MKKFYKIVSIICILVFCCGLFLYKSPTAKAIKEFRVDIKPQRVGTVATYKFIFTIEKDLDVHDQVQLVFPPGTTLTPPIPENEKDRLQRFKNMLDYIYFGTIPCGPCGSLPRFETLADGSLKMEITSVLTYEVKVKPKVVITIFSQAGFTNPPKPGKVIYKLSTQHERDSVEAPYEFFDSKLSALKVYVMPPGFFQPVLHFLSLHRHYVMNGFWLMDPRLAPIFWIHPLSLRFQYHWKLKMLKKSMLSSIVKLVSLIPKIQGITRSMFLPPQILSKNPNPIKLLAPNQYFDWKQTK